MTGKRAPLLAIHNLNLMSPSGDFLFRFNFSLETGSILLLKGPNGSGKSTFLRLLFEHLKKEKRSHEIIDCSKVESFSYLPQSLNRDFFIPLSLKDVADLHPQSKKQDRGLLDSTLQEKSWNLSSGGEKQKALLSQCLATPSQLYLLDEPFNHLDQESIQSFVQKLQIKCSQEGCSFLIASHLIPKNFENLEIQTQYLEMKSEA